MDKIRKKRKRSSQNYAVSPKARVIVILIGEEKDSDAVWVQNLKYELDLLNFSTRKLYYSNRFCGKNVYHCAATCCRRLALC